MKAKVLILIAIFSLALTTNAQIKLGSLKNKIKKTKKKKTEEKKETVKSKSTDNNNLKSENSISTSINSNAFILDYVLMKRSNFTLGYTNGLLKLNKIRAMYLPQSLDKTRNFIIKYKSAKGKTLATFSGYAQAPGRNPSWLIGNILGVDDASKDFKFSNEGDYYLEFSAGNQAFDKFHFSIIKHTDPDGKIRYLKKGNWDDLAYLHYDPKSRSKYFTFNVYMRDLLEGTGKRSHDYGNFNIKLVREKDGRILGWINKNGRERINPLRIWTRSSYVFQDADQPQNLTAEKVLAQDGKYHVAFTFDGKLYGKYAFSVLGGKFQSLPEHNGDKIGTDEIVTWMKRN